MFAFLRGASVVAAIAWWSPTHERPADASSAAGGLRPSDADASPLRDAAAEPVAELRRAMRNVEATRRALAGSPLAGSPLAEAAGELLSRARPLHEAIAAGGGQAGPAAPRPR